MTVLLIIYIIFAVINIIICSIMTYIDYGDKIILQKKNKNILK